MKCGSAILFIAAALGLAGPGESAVFRYEMTTSGGAVFGFSLDTDVVQSPSWSSGVLMATVAGFGDAFGPPGVKISSITILSEYEDFTGIQPTQIYFENFDGPAMYIQRWVLSDPLIEGPNTSPIFLEGTFAATRFNRSNPTGQTGTLRVSEIDTAGAVPEPASWAMMLAGFGAIGAAMRGRRRVAVRFG